jgi:uncharacterized protein
MADFNFDMASEFARRRLETRLPPYLFYHSAVHTMHDVVPAAKKLAQMEEVEGDDLLLLLTGAWFHDLGFIFINGDTTLEYKLRVSQHEEASAAIARQVLPDFGYAPGEVEVVVGTIMATKLPQTPHNLLEQIVADADLDSIGRSDFWKVSYRLKEELATFGMPMGEDEWLTRQLSFLQSHHYFSPSAKKLRQPGKKENIKEIQVRLREMQTPSKVTQPALASRADGVAPR